MLNIDQIRRDFPILQQEVYGRPLVYLDNAATTHKPRPVLDAVLDFYTTSNSNIHRGIHFLSEQASEVYEKARATVQNYIGAAKPEEIVFTRSTTDSINLLAGAFGRGMIGRGDEILVSEMEHHSNIVPWQMLCERTGAELKVLPFDDSGQLQLELLDTLLTGKTKLLAVTQVSNVLGLVNPVQRIVAKAHSHGVPVLVDGAQAVQHLDVDVQKLDCDFFVFSGHKIYAEMGIGVLYGKQEWLEKLPPGQFGGGMIETVTMQKTTFEKPPFKFEAGTPNVAAAASLGAALDYVSGIGLATIAEHEKTVLDYAAATLSDLPGVTVYGDAAEHCGALSFNIDGVSAYDAGMILDKLGVAVRTGKHCADPVMQHYGINGTIRASFAVYNRKEDVDALAAGLQRAIKMLRDS